MKSFVSDLLSPSLYLNVLALKIDEHVRHWKFDQLRIETGTDDIKLPQGHCYRSENKKIITSGLCKAADVSQFKKIFLYHQLSFFGGGRGKLQFITVSLRGTSSRSTRNSAAAFHNYDRY